MLLSVVLLGLHPHGQRLVLISFCKVNHLTMRPTEVLGTASVLMGCTSNTLLLPAPDEAPGVSKPWALASSVIGSGTPNTVLPISSAGTSSSLSSITMSSWVLPHPCAPSASTIIVVHVVATAGFSQALTCHSTGETRSRRSINYRGTSLTTSHEIAWWLPHDSLGTDSTLDGAGLMTRSLA